MTSYLLAVRCRKERRTISHGSIISHRDYGERMPLTFNNEIQSEYYGNTSVSVEGSSLEWVDVEEGVWHTWYFGHWSDDSKQDAAATTRNMHYELCVDGDATKLVEGLEIGGTVWKGTDGAAVSYCCGKSIYGQAKLSALLHVTIDAQVDAPGHGKWWLDGKKRNGQALLPAKHVLHCEVGAISTADEAMMGYYVVKWLSNPYTLQEETKGMSGMIGVGMMVVDVLYFNQVERARHWYTQSNMTTVVEV